MTRAFRAIQFGLALLTLVLLGGHAEAGKPKIAILGIEAVVGANGQIDTADTQFAKELTKALRSRADNSAMYEPTKDQRELVDEKLMGNCGSEDPKCMAPIGASMGAEVILFGKVENAKGGWKVTLTLVSVSKRQQLQQERSVFIPAGDAKSSAALARWVYERYRKLTGESSDGTLVIKVAGANSGRVLVNGETRETLRSGSASIPLPEGRYRIGVDADGFKLWEKDGVTIAADRSTELSPDLTKSGDTGTDTTTGTTGIGDTGTVIKREGTVSGKKSKTLFKVIAGVGLGGAAVTGALWGYQYFGPIAAFKNYDVPDGTMFTGGITNITDANCGGGEFSGTDESNANSKFTKACDAKDLTKILVPTTIALGLIGGAALVYVIVSKDETETRPAVSGRHKKRRNRNLVVTPVVTPDGTGATLRFDW